MNNRDKHDEFIRQMKADFPNSKLSEMKRSLIRKVYSKDLKRKRRSRKSDHMPIFDPSDLSDWLDD